jgi:agmatine/peptidylarginine deiminase
MHRLLPEWVEQEAVLLAWPHANTDWAPWLSAAHATYQQLIFAILEQNARVLLLVDYAQLDAVQTLFAEHGNVVFIPAKFNDTWVRDYGFLTTSDGSELRALEFQFNGWGQKFNAELDNQVNIKYLADQLQVPLFSELAVVEGGALEIDADGILLSTQLCLTNPKRNGEMTLEEYRSLFADTLGAKQTIILEHGHLAGDDTDGHIDTLARFTPNQGVVYQGCENRPTDPHFSGLHALGAELQHHLPEHTLFALPLPEIFSAEGERLPASYANFLILNGAILAPIYQQPEDAEALAVLAQAYPDYTIVPIDCSVLIQQYGSLHCITMQIPKGVLA